MPIFNNATITNAFIVEPDTRVKTIVDFYNSKEKNVVKKIFTFIVFS